MDKKRRKQNKTLKKKINEYILKKSDICCESDIDKNVLIDKIFKNYEKIAEFWGDKDSDYLSYISNDIPIFIGYKMELQEQKDTEGVKLWNMLSKKPDKIHITKLLNDLPLYYLLALLGYSEYKLE